MKNNRRTQAERSSATRAALIAAGRRLFAEHGYSGVGTDAIVRAAGVTRGALYHHFGDKSELLAAAFEAVESEVIGIIAKAVDASGAPDAIEKMRVGGAAWLDACGKPEIHRIALLEAPAILGVARWREIGARYGMGLVRELLGQAIAEGEVSAQPVDPLAHILLGAIREGGLYIAVAENKERARREVGVAVDQLLMSLRKR